MPGIITTETRLTLVNAIYLKAAWQTPFPESGTKAGAFNLADGSSVEVPMMATTASLPYAAGDGWRAVELPYIGGSLAMTVIVPDDLAAFEASLSAEQLAGSSATCASTSDAGLPEVRDRDQGDARRRAGGARHAERLRPRPRRLLRHHHRGGAFISDVVHQANIDVDEKGTTAAAATAVVMRATASPEHVALQVDRPFLFALRDVPTGAVLFLGRVSDPSVGY